MFSQVARSRLVGSILVERMTPTGAYILTWLGDGERFTATYMGYSQRDALALFRRERRERQAR
jgi:hypothetical protein